MRSGWSPGGAQPSSINRRLTVCRQLYCFHYPDALESDPGTSLPAPYYRGPGRDRRLGVHLRRKKPARALRVKTPDRQVSPLSGEQVRSFLRSLRRYRDMAIVHLMLLNRPSSKFSSSLLNGYVSEDILVKCSIT